MANKSLWDFYDGEAFMENPPLGLLGVNKPRKTRKKGKKMAARKRRSRKGRMPAGLKRYWATHRRTGKKHAPARKRRARRRNWISSGLVVPPNPRKRRSHRRSANPKRRHHRRRNPDLLGINIPPLKSIAFGAVGFAGPSLVSGFLNSTVPSVMQTISSLGIAGKYIIKAGSIYGLSWLTRRFIGRGEANMVIVGGSINIGMSLLYDFVPGLLPANPLGMYVPTRPGMQSYVPVRQGLQAVPQTQQLIRQIPTAAAFPMGNGVSGASKFGGSAQRLYRY